MDCLTTALRRGCQSGEEGHGKDERGQGVVHVQNEGARGTGGGAWAQSCGLGARAASARLLGQTVAARGR